VHPYTTFNGMAADDLKALVAFLRSVPPVKAGESTQEDLGADVRERVLARVARGVRADRKSADVGAVDRCRARRISRPRRRPLRRVPHPRTMTMATDNSRFLARQPQGPRGLGGAEITPDKTTGFNGRRRRSPIISDGQQARRRRGRRAHGEVIEGTLSGYKDLTKADRLAIAKYLKTIPPIKNKIGK